MDFLILGYPRSATTWLSNLFTTDRSICLHDPISYLTISEIEDYQSPGKYVGAACTGLWMLPEWVNSRDCPVITIMRDKAECDASLLELGMSPIPDEVYVKLGQCRGPKIAFEDIWKTDVMAGIWAYLLPHIPFDAERYNMLRSISMQPLFQEVPVNPAAVRDYIRRMQGG